MCSTMHVELVPYYATFVLSKTNLNDPQIFALISSAKRILIVHCHSKKKPSRKSADHYLFTAIALTLILLSRIFFLEICFVFTKESEDINFILFTQNK